MKVADARAWELRYHAAEEIAADAVSTAAGGLSATPIVAAESWADVTQADVPTGAGG